jgi:hypothetical protein
MALGKLTVKYRSDNREMRLCHEKANAICPYHDGILSKKKELDGAKGFWFFHAPFALPSSYYAYLY